MISPEEKLLSDFIEQTVGGTVRRLERQARWRKAWFVDVERDGRLLPLYVRGDKQLDAAPYPGLAREAAILRHLEAGGVMVPHVHGLCENPEAIVMDRVPGVRDVSLAADDRERQTVAFEYIEQLAKMHRLDVQPFVETGLELPVTATEIQLAYLNANQNLYNRTKRLPEPLIEFGLRWLRRNVPQHRTKACFIHSDAGQFLFDRGHLSCLYDFEASHLGDPLADLAGLRTRHPTEPLGAEVDELLSHYQEVTNREIDLWALSFHTAAFMMTAVMSLAGPLNNPAANLQAEYLIWDLTTKRALLWAIAECLGVKIPVRPAPAGNPSRNGTTITVLRQTLQRFTPAVSVDEGQKNAALLLTDWLEKTDEIGVPLAAEDMEDIATLLGHRPVDWRAADAELEQFVLQAGPAYDECLLLLFARQIEGRALIAASLGERLAGYALKPVTLS
jgi:aminoglycoside phosphotransferase (APT) family kinase protein